MNEFCGQFGQIVSEAKSKVYISPNVDRDMRDFLCNILGFQSTPNIGKYLGIPIKHPSPSSHDFNFVLDWVKQKLSGWKAKLLSLVKQPRPGHACRQPPLGTQPRHGHAAAKAKAAPHGHSAAKA